MDRKTKMAMGWLLAAALATGCAAGYRIPAVKGGPAAVTIAADAARPAGVLDHQWEAMTGSGNARLYLMPGWSDRTLAQLADVHTNLGIQQVRFHNIFCDDVGIYQGPGQYDFTKADRVYDAVLAAGVKPFVELSFMPQALASGRARGFPLGYRPFISPPKDYDEWARLVEAFARHLVARYGLAEVKGWRFEVWNEPNYPAFWSGKLDDYFRLYDATARAVKAVSPELQVGGPASSGPGGGWVLEFIDHCVRTGAPVDFISTHCYYGEAPGQDLARQLERRSPGASAPLTGSRFQDQLVQIHRVLEHSPYPGLPVLITEWGSSSIYSYHMPLSLAPNDHDLPNDAAFMARAVKEDNGLAAAYSHWCYSDVFEEWGLPGAHWPVKRAAFHGGFGLITIDGIHKPSYHAFAFLHRMGRGLVATEVSGGVKGLDALVTMDDGRLAVLVWYWLDTVNAHAKAGPPAAVSLTLAHLPPATKGKKLFGYRIDQDHGNPFAEWLALGKPGNLSAEQVQRLKQLSDGTLRAPELDRPITGPGLSLDFALPPAAVVFLTTDPLEPAPAR